MFWWYLLDLIFSSKSWFPIDYLGKKLIGRGMSRDQAAKFVKQKLNYFAQVIHLAKVYKWKLKFILN